MGYWILKSSYRALAVLALVAVWSLSLIAHEEPSSPATTAPQTAPAKANLDSAYTIITAGYERLKPVFEDGCFDCHSDKTDFPWYHSLPIIEDWMSGHVKEARQHLDFSNGFPFGGHGRQADNLYAIKEEAVVEGDMPLWQYRLMHWGAAPNREEKDSIAAWVDRSLILLAAHGQYPFNNPENVPKTP